MNKQTLRKELSREVKGNREIVTNDIEYKSDFITKDEIEELFDYFNDDYEHAYAWGCPIDFMDEMVWIDFKQLWDGLNDWFANCNEDDKDTVRYDIFDKLHKKAQKYNGYTIWL